MKGTSRAVTILAAYLMRNKGKNFSQSMKLMAKAGIEPTPNYGYSLIILFNIFKGFIR